MIKFVPVKFEREPLSGKVMMMVLMSHHGRGYYWSWQRDLKRQFKHGYRVREFGVIYNG